MRRIHAWPNCPIDTGSEAGSEHIAIGPDGKLYASDVKRQPFAHESRWRKREVFATTVGRVLGFDFDAKGQMIAADPMKGLLSIAADGAVTMLTDHNGPNDPIV